MKKILVIDDETITIQIIRFTLEENANLLIKISASLTKNVPFVVIGFDSSYGNIKDKVASVFPLF